MTAIPYHARGGYQSKRYLWCTICYGKGLERSSMFSVRCKGCAGTGLDIIPWAELFMIGREKDVRE